MIGSLLLAAALLPGGENLNTTADGRRRLILADESRARLHYYDSFYPSKCFSVELKKPLWDLKPVGDMRYRTVCHGGFQVTDMKARKVVDEFRYPGFVEQMATAVCDLPDGGFVFSANPQDAEKGKAIHFYEFGPDRRLRRILKMPGYFYARSMLPGRDGEWLVAHEKGFARVRLPATGEAVEIVKNYPQPVGRNLFAVIPARDGGYLAGCGYKGGLVRFDDEGETLSQWFVPTDTGKESYFYAQVEERPDGHIYLAHWTGHGERDSYKGWQAVEFDRDGKVLWHLDSPDRFGSISGIVVLEEPAELTTDVAVVGGGSAGFAAAWNAARLGSSVVLVERADRLGGTSTVGGVSNWEPDCGATGTPRIVYERMRRKPNAAGVYVIDRHCSWDDPKNPVFPGALCVIDPALDYGATLRRHGPGMGDKAWFRENCHGVIFEPDALADTMREMLDETGRCRTLLNTLFVAAEKDAAGNVRSLTLSDGTVIRPKIVIDACGAVCKAIGCRTMTAPRPNGATLIYRVASGGTRCAEELAAKPECWWGRFPYAFCERFPNGDVLVNMLPTMSGEEAVSRSRADLLSECRRRVFAHWAWMKTRWPEFAAWRIKEVCGEVACRETFRVEGEYVLTGADVAHGVRPPDEIAIADHALDRHGGDGFGGELKQPYGIPFRCLLPKGTANVMIVGRCASFDPKAASSCRLARTMMQLGEAAGVAAHTALERGVPLRAVHPVRPDPDLN